VVETPKKRIDSTDKRETLFGKWRAAGGSSAALQPTRSIACSHLHRTPRAVCKLHVMPPQAWQAPAPPRPRSATGAALLLPAAGGGDRSAWLSEADVDFFTGGGTTESPAALDPVAQAQVQRRLLIGGIASVGLAAFALIPTKVRRGQRRQCGSDGAGRSPTPFSRAS
jgi:hypothetical protein